MIIIVTVSDVCCSPLSAFPGAAFIEICFEKNRVFSPSLLIWRGGVGKSTCLALLKFLLMDAFHSL